MQPEDHPIFGTLLADFGYKKVLIPRILMQIDFFYVIETPDLAL